MINIDKYESAGTYWIALYWIVTMWHTSIVLEFNTFQKKLKIHRQQKCDKKYLYNTSIPFNNVLD